MELHLFGDRYSTLRSERAIPDITQKMLGQLLRAMARVALRYGLSLRCRRRLTIFPNLGSSPLFPLFRPF
jgi:hypothetical protein